MKKGTKLAALLLGLALVIPACNVNNSSKAPDQSSADPASEVTPSSEPEGQSSDAGTSSEEQINYTVTISNKDALQAEWFVGDQSRKVELNIEPKANITQLVNEGVIQISSSNAEILSITGQMASPVAAGEATITVKCGESQDTVAVTLKAKQTVKEKYGVAHEGTEADPFDNEDACKVAKSDKYSNEDFYVKGTVDRFYYAPGARTDGNVAFYLKAATAGGEQFEVFKCYKDKEQKVALTDDDIWVGGVVTAHGQFTVYNKTQAETTSAIFVKCEGTKPQPRQTLTKTFAETLALGVALADGADSYDFIKFQGYVTAKDGNNYFLTATKGEALVSGKSDAAHGERDIKGTNAIELYNAGKVAELAAKLLENAKVEVTMIVKNYHGTIENGKDLVDADVTVVEAGTNWAVPEPTVATRTLKEFIDGENKKDKAYYVTATVKSWKTAEADKDKYGNMVLTDGTNDLVVYGASATATALAWDNSSAYAFTNPQDFLTNETTAALKIGDEVTMKLIRADYTKDGNTTIQGSGIITKVTPAGQQVTYKLVEKFDFVSSLTKHEAYDSAKMDAFIKGSSSLGENTNYVSHDASEAATKPLIGANGGSGDTAWSNYNLLKLGSTSKNCKIALTFKDGTAISRVVVKATGWVGKTCKLGVNGGEQVTIPSFTDGAKVVDGSAYASFTFDLASPAKVITLETTLTVLISEIEFYAIDGGEQQPEIAQPTGAFRGLAKSKAGTFLPVDMILAADSVTLYANGDAVAVTSYEWDKVEGQLTIVTDAAGYGTIVAKLDVDNNVFQITSINGTAALASLDLTYAVKLSGNCQFLDCEQDVTGLSNIFQRRKKDYSADNSKPWEAANTDRIFSDDNGKVGKGLRVQGWKDGMISIALKNDLNNGQGIQGDKVKDAGVWIYNPNTDDSVVVKVSFYIFKEANYGGAAQLKEVTLEKGWNYFQCGISLSSSEKLYNFMFYLGYRNVNLVYDNFCLYM